MTIAEAAAAVLARPPRVPDDIDLFTSNALFGQPGIYPEGTPMQPASGGAPTLEAARSELERLLLARRVEASSVASALERFDATTFETAAPDPGVRASLLLLSGTVAAPLIDAFPERTAVQVIRYGEPASPGRVVGPAATDDGVAAPSNERVVSERYVGEHPALLSGSLAHDLLWDPTLTSHAAETLLHALVAMVHVQLVAADPALARCGTELARRQSSLAITLLNSRRPGSARVVLHAPDGPGTIPGGATNMQTPDFWSVPFAPIGDDEAPALFGEVVDQLVPPSIERPPVRFDEEFGRWLSAHLDDRWLPWHDHARAAIALGLISLDEIAAEAGVSIDEVQAALDDQR